MRKVILALTLLTLSAVANGASMTLISHNGRTSGGGGLFTYTWDGSDVGTPGGIAVGATASTATWDWDGSTMTSTGYYQATVYASGTALVSDVVVDMVIDTVANTTGATSYECRQQNLFDIVGFCLGTSDGTNNVHETSVAYNIGGDPNCIDRTVGGDDIVANDPHGLSTPGSGGGCDTQIGEFDLWTILQDDGVPGGTLILSNGPIADPGARYMTWQYAEVVPVPAAAWLFASALGALGWVRRRQTAA